MGLLMAAMFGGMTFGPLLGGFVADSLGYRAAFFITGALLFSGGLIVLFFVKERFQHPAKGQAASLGSLLRLVSSREMLPLLVVLCAMQVSSAMTIPIIPLFVRELDPGGMTATASGLALSLRGAIAAISAMVAGRLSGRITLKKMLAFSCLGTGLLYLPPMWAKTVGQFLIFIALTGLLRGGLVTSSNALVGLSVSRSQQGIAYGIAQSAKSLGSAFGPLIGGSLASLLGLKPIFGVTGGLFMLIGIFVTKLLAGQPLERTESKR